MNIGGVEVKVPDIELDGYKWGSDSIYALKDIKYYRTTESHDFYAVAKALGSVDGK